MRFSEGHHSNSEAAAQNGSLIGSGHSEILSLNKLYVDAEPAWAELKDMVFAIADDFDVEARVPNLKDARRTLQKLVVDYNGDVSRIRDVARCAIVCKDYAEIQQVWEAIESNGLVVESRNRFETPSETGYRDVNLKCQMSNGHVVEIQLQLEAMLQAAKTSHEFYEEIRSVRADAAHAGVALSAEQQEYVASLVQTCRKIHDNAARNAGVDVAKPSRLDTGANAVKEMVTVMNRRVGMTQSLNLA